MNSKGFISDAIFCVLMIAGIAGCGSGRHEYFYASLIDANKDGAITRRWIPEFLPASSKNLHVTGELSPGSLWCAFEFVPRDSKILLKSLQPIEMVPPSMTRIPDPEVPWWPAALQGNLELEKIRKMGFRLYVAEIPETSVTTDLILFVVDWNKGLGFLYGT